MSSNQTFSWSQCHWCVNVISYFLISQHLVWQPLLWVNVLCSVKVPWVDKRPERSCRVHSTDSPWHMGEHCLCDCDDFEQRYKWSLKVESKPCPSCHFRWIYDLIVDLLPAVLCLLFWCLTNQQCLVFSSTLFHLFSSKSPDTFHIGQVYSVVYCL